MIRFLHGADLHLNAPILKLPPQKARLLQEEARQAFIRLIDTAISESVQVVLLCGDLVDSSVPDADTLSFFKRQFQRIADIPVFLIGGNHDPAPLYAEQAFGENVTVFGENFEKIELPEHNLAVYGNTLPGRYAPQAVNPETINLLLQHGTLTPQDGYNATLTEEALAQSGMDYVALGHVHQRTPLKRAGATFYAYSGALTSKGFDECYETGFYIGTLDKGAVELTFHATDSRSFRQLTVSCENKTSAELTEAVLQQTNPRDCFRVTVTGASEYFYKTAVENALAEQLFYVEVEDATTFTAPQADPYSLKGRFLKKTAENPLAARFGLAALEGRPIDVED